jgi:hypothetical protein
MKILLTASLLVALSVPAASAAPPEGKGKPEKTKAATAQQADENAAKRCKAERQQMGAAAFAGEYGTNGNKRNAFGKCVSRATRDETEAEQEDAENDENAAKRCKAERQAMGAARFADEYGTNPNKRNAFGKCVSRKSKQTS